MSPDELKRRTKAFGLKIIELVESLPHTRTADMIGRQLLRCGTSVGANYRAACRAKSKPDFISKMANVEEEADKSIYWMEVLVEAKIVQRTQLVELEREGDEILSIIVSSINTVKRKKKS